MSLEDACVVVINGEIFLGELPSYLLFLLNNNVLLDVSNTRIFSCNPAVFVFLLGHVAFQNNWQCQHAVIKSMLPSDNSPLRGQSPRGHEEMFHFLNSNKIFVIEIFQIKIQWSVLNNTLVYGFLQTCANQIDVEIVHILGL